MTIEDLKKLPVGNSAMPNINTVPSGTMSISQLKSLPPKSVSQVAQPVPSVVNPSVAKDKASATRTNAVFPANTPDASHMNALDKTKYVLGDAAKLAGNIVTSPYSLLKTAGTAVVGLPSAGVKAVDNLSETAAGIAKSQDPLRDAKKIPGILYNNVADAIINKVKTETDSFKDNPTEYGFKVVEALHRQIINDPVGTALVTKGGFDLLKKAAVASGNPTIINAMDSIDKSVSTIAKPVIDTGSSVMGAGSNALKSVVGSKHIVGEKNADIIAANADEQAKLFSSGKKTLADVAQETHDAVTEFEKQGMAQLKSVKDKLPSTNSIPDKTIADAVNSGIVKSVNSSAEYKGVAGDLNSVDNIINKGILNEAETKIVKNSLDKIKNWTDTSTRGLLNLKEELDKYVRPGESYTGSNSIVRSIQRELKTVVADSAPGVGIKDGLLRASNDMAKADYFKENLLGGNVSGTESKLKSLLVSFRDPALLEDKTKLLQELKDLTGRDILPQIQGYFNYKNLLGIKEPGILNPLDELKYLATKAVANLPKNK